MTNIHHLELFHYVARHKGISAAARQMPYGVGQPAISEQIKLLEEHLGYALFQRTPFELSPRGAILAAHIASFFDRIEVLVDRLRSPHATQFRIAASDFVQREYLPDVVAMMQRRAPGVGFAMMSGPQAQIEDWLRTGAVDLAIAALTETLPAGVEALPVLRFAPVLLVPNTKEHRAIKSAEDFFRAGAAMAPLVCPPETEGVTRVFHHGLKLRGIHWPVAVQVKSADVVTRYVASGGSVGLSLDLPLLVSHPGVRVLPLKGFQPVPYGVVWQAAAGKPAELLSAILGRARMLWPEVEVDSGS